MTTSRIYAYRWPARLVSHKPFAAERYFITSACIWQVFFCDFSEKIRFFFFIFFFLCPGTNFVQNAQSRRLFSVENPADSSRMPRQGGVYTKKPLSQRIRVASFLVQRCFGEEPLSLAFGSPAPLSRGATGVPVLVLLDEQSFLEPKNKVLRCLGAQHLYERPWLERSIDAVCLSSGALLFAKDKTSGVQQGLPDLPKAPLFRKDSLRPEGDVAQATEGGRLALRSND